MKVSTRLNSFFHAVRGIAVFVKGQANAKIEITAAILVVLFGLYFQVSAAEWCFLIIAMSMVFIAEVFNSGLELLSDIVSPEYDARIKDIKDMAAGGVLITACSSALVAAIIFVPKIIDCCFS